MASEHSNISDSERKSQDEAEASSRGVRLSHSSSTIPVRRSRNTARKKSGGSNYRQGNRGSSTTGTHLELLADLKSRDRYTSGISGNVTEFGSFQSKTSFNPKSSRSLRLDSEVSKPSSLSNKKPSKKKRTVADFMIGEKIGEGSYARVQVVKLKETGAFYAMKVMDIKHIMKTGMKHAVKREMQVLGGLQCSNIIKLFWAFHEKSFLYMVLELCQGGDLSKLIKHYSSDSNRCIPMADIKFYVAETIVGLQFLHHKGLIHRDIKPENLLISNEGHIKVCDFGTVKDESKSKDKEVEKQFVGSANYVSPEVIDEKYTSVGADIWAVGVLLYHLLIGKPPFIAPTEFLIFENIGNFCKNSEEIQIPLQKSSLSSSSKSVKDEESSGEEEKKKLSGDELMLQDLISRLLRPDPAKRLGCCNNYTPKHPKFDRQSENKACKLREHSFFDDISWSTLSLTKAPFNPVYFKVKEPEFDGNDTLWQKVGDPTDLDVLSTFSKQLRKAKPRTNSSTPGGTRRERRDTRNNFSSTLRSIEIQPVSQQFSLQSSSSVHLSPMKKSDKIKTKKYRLAKSKSKKLSKFLSKKPTMKLKKKINLDRPSLSLGSGRKNKGKSKLRRKSKESIVSNHNFIDDEKVYKHLEPTEEIILSSLIKKKNNLFTSKRYLVLTNKPRFIYFEINKEDNEIIITKIKGEIIINLDTIFEINEENNTFIINNTKINYYFICYNTTTNNNNENKIKATKWKLAFLKQQQSLS